MSFRLQDLKYLAAYLVPATACVGLCLRGPWVLLTVLFSFVLVPLLELLIPRNTKNLSDLEVKQKSVSRVFDLLLYLNVPIVYGILGWLVYLLKAEPLSAFEQFGLIATVGIVVGGNGINVAHELGHRTTRLEQFLADCLLLPALYLHFRIDHNRGHHFTVATPDDPSTAKRGESVYSFWWRSTTGSWQNAWALEKHRLEKRRQRVIGLHNGMLIRQSVQCAYLVAAGLIFGWQVALSLLGVAVTAALLLETINYIEHYGLLRSKLDNGRYERVAPVHSWNSDFQLGRIMLYELTRHSDHHHVASRPYQLLQRHEVSPELPFGYPAAMLLSLVPPLWFRLIHQRLDKTSKS